MSGIFISYRRDDSSGYAGRLFDRLVAEFGRERVFMDIEALAPGTDFVDAIDHAVGSCEALIALIGNRWVDAADAKGRRRLDDPHDFIRLEIATALRRGVTVIPVLLKGATMPGAEELPEDLAPLARRQALELSDTRWDYDAGCLVEAIGHILPADSPPGKRTPDSPPESAAVVRETPKPGSRRWMVIAVATLALGIGVWLIGPSLVKKSDEDPSARVDAPAIDRASSSLARPNPPPVSAFPSRIEVTEPVEPPPPPPDQEAAAPEPAPASPESPGVPETPASEPSEPPPVPQPADRTAQLIESLLRQAEADLAQRRLTIPPGNNAFERYQQVLELDPGNEEARAGIIRVGEAYLELARGRLATGRLEEAARYLEQGAAFTPDAREIAALREALEEQRQEAARRELAGRRAAEQEQADRINRARQRECIAACERAEAECLEGRDDRSAAQSCLRAGVKRCERQHRQCETDPQRLLVAGAIATEAACAGEWQQCRNRVAEECAAGASPGESQCRQATATCVAACD